MRGKENEGRENRLIIQLERASLYKEWVGRHEEKKKRERTYSVWESF